MASSELSTEGLPSIDEEIKAVIAKKAKAATKDLNKLMSARYEPVSSYPGMEVIRDIRNLEADKRKDIVVRSITKKFWQTCIEIVDEVPLQDEHPRRVAAIGTPGIGKTLTTAVLIRMLLEKQKTVVYLIRQPYQQGWIYEMSPRGGRYEVKVYRESVPYFAIPSLRLATTYFIVDPGRTKDDCNPVPSFLPKVIIVASPDSGHWGDMEFTKYRVGGSGTFRHYPVWSLEELRAARPIVFPGLTEVEISERYRLFGGSPRYVEEVPHDLLEKQKDAVAQLSKIQVENIALGRFDTLKSYNPDLPQSVLVAYDLPLDNEGKRMERFDEYRVVLASPVVEELGGI
jgi:hypothetical protein